MFARERSFQHTDDYALLRRCLGNLTPTVAQIEQFCKLNPRWDWDNFPIDPRMFPKHPRVEYSASKEVFYELQRLVVDSDRNKIEYSFLLVGTEHATALRGAVRSSPLLYFSRIHFNRGQATYNSLSIENQCLRDNYNAEAGRMIMLGHTHPNYGNTRKCFSICDILYGITNIAWLRQQAPQPLYKVTFSVAYTGDDGICRHVPLMYDPTNQQKGGSAIFRLI